MDDLARNSAHQNGFAPPPPPDNNSFSSFDSSCHNGGFVFDDNSEGGSNNNSNNNKNDSLTRVSSGENQTATPSSHDALAFWERQRRLFDRMHLTFASSEPPQAPSCVKLEIAGSESLLINISEPHCTGTALGIFLGRTLFSQKASEKS